MIIKITKNVRSKIIYIGNVNSIYTWNQQTNKTKKNDNYQEIKKKKQTHGKRYKGIFCSKKSLEKKVGWWIKTI